MRRRFGVLLAEARHAAQLSVERLARDIALMHPEMRGGAAVVLKRLNIRAIRRPPSPFRRTSGSR